MVDYKPIGKQFAGQLGLDWNLVDRVVTQESGWQQYRPDGTILTSKAGALGLTQLMPATAAGLGVNPRDPIQNLRGGLTYLAQMLHRYSGNVAKALVGYNAGPGKADTWNGTRSNLTVETRQYLDAILGPNWQPGGIPTDPTDPTDPNGPGTDTAGGLFGVVQQWIEQVGHGVVAGAQNQLIDQYAGPILAIAGIALLGMGIFALVMRTPPMQAASQIAGAIPNPVAQGISAAGRATAPSPKPAPSPKTAPRARKRKAGQPFVMYYQDQRNIRA